MEDGQNSEVAILGPLVVRRARSASAANGLLREERLLAVIGQVLPIAVPRTTVITAGSHVLSVHEMLPGAPAHGLVRWGGAERRNAIEILARFLAALHALVPPVSVPRYDAAWWRSWGDRIGRTTLGYLPASFGAYFDGWLTFQVNAMAAARLRLIHGDLGAGNVLADGARITGVIDFGSAGVGDPLWDIASLAASFGTELALEVAASCDIEVPGKRHLAFYRLAFALMELAIGVEQSDDDVVASGARAAIDFRERYPAD